MKRLILFFIPFLLSSCAYQLHYEEPQFLQGQKAVWPTVNPKFKVGEKLIYAVSWLGISSGHITLEVKEGAVINGIKTAHINATARPNSFFSFFYDIEYDVDSYIDLANQRPVRFYKRRRYKKEINEEIMEFDYKNKKVYCQYTNPDVKGSLDMPQDPQDLLSALYYFRMQKDISTGKFSMNIIYRGQAWPLVFSSGKVANIQLPGNGKFRVVEISSSSELATHIIGFRGFDTFFSLDSDRKPILFKMPSNIGRLIGVLVNPDQCQSSS